MLANENYQLRIIDCLTELDTIKDKWKSFQWHPNADFDYYKQYIQNKIDTTPYIVVIEHELDIVAIYVGRICNREVKITLGYKTIFRNNLKSLTFIYGGILGTIKEKEVKMFVSHLDEQLCRKKVEVIYIDNVDTRTEFYKKLNLSKKNNILYQKTTNNLHWRMTLPKTIKDFYSGLPYKLRKNIRRSQRSLYDKSQSPVKIKCFTSVNDIDYVFEKNEAIAQKTYQRGIGVGFESSNLSKSLMQIAAKNGWMKSYILYVNTDAIAFDRVYLYNRNLFLQDGGYDPCFKKIEPGTNLFLKILEDHCGNQKIDYIDFGFGDASYKRRFCDFSWEEQTIAFFGKTLKCFVISILFFLSIKTNETLSNLLKYLKVYEKVKNYWRIHSIKDKS